MRKNQESIMKEIGWSWAPSDTEDLDRGGEMEMSSVDKS